jgi:hypothetical protein
MTRQVLISLLVASLPTSQALAGDIKTSMSEAARRSASSQSRPAARGENPYETPGLVLLGVGGGVLVYGLLYPTGVDCTDRSTRTNVSFDCGTTHSAGVTIAGAAMAGVGTFLLWRGQQNRSRGPEVAVKAGSMAIQQRIRW